jgi:hypothetical protein
MCCASLLETVREKSARLCGHLADWRFRARAGALLLSPGPPKLYRKRWHENRRADCEIAARAGVFRLRPECLPAIPQGPYTRRFRRTVSSGSIPVALMSWRSAQRRRLALLLLINRFVALALTILGPVIANILLYHLLLKRVSQEQSANAEALLPVCP